MIDGRDLLLDGNGTAVNLSQLTKHELHHIWVLMVSVFAKKRVLQRLTLSELLAIWDYASKTRYTGMLDTYVWGLLHARLLSSPAKILTSIVLCLPAAHQKIDAYENPSARSRVRVCCLHHPRNT